MMNQIAPRYWLMKSEPDLYSIDDLARDGVTPWTGVRNYQARNYMRDDMRVGDLVLFYHSSVEPPGVAGVGKVSRVGISDFTARDPKSPYFDPKATETNPIWVMVEIAFVKKYPRLVTLTELRGDPALKDMLVLRKGMRLSVQPVTPSHFRRVEMLAKG